MTYTNDQGNNIRSTITPNKTQTLTGTVHLGTTEGVGNADSLNIPSLSSKVIDRTFGRK